MEANTTLTWINDTPIVLIDKEKELVFWHDTKPISSKKGSPIYAVRGQLDKLQLWSIKDGNLIVEQITDLSTLESKQ